MLLNDNDNVTPPQIVRLLDLGVRQLTPMRSKLIDAFFLTKIRAPKRFFRMNYMMSGKQVDGEIQQALIDLRKHFTQQGITSLADFCVD